MDSSCTTFSVSGCFHSWAVPEGWVVPTPLGPAWGLPSALCGALRRLAAGQSHELRLPEPLPRSRCS